MCTASASCCRRYSIETPSFSTATSRQKVGRRIVNLDSSSCCFGFSRQWAPPRIVLHLYRRSSSSFITTVTAMSSLAASRHLILRIPVTFSLAVPCSQSFCQYTHHRSSLQSLPCPLSSHPNTSFYAFPLPFPLPFHARNPSVNIPIIVPPYKSKPPQLCADHHS